MNQATIARRWGTTEWQCRRCDVTWQSTPGAAATPCWYCGTVKDTTIRYPNLPRYRYPPLTGVQLPH